MIDILDGALDEYLVINRNNHQKLYHCFVAEEIMSDRVHCLITNDWDATRHYARAGKLGHKNSRGERLRVKVAGHKKRRPSWIPPRIRRDRNLETRESPIRLVESSLSGTYLTHKPPFRGNKGNGSGLVLNEATV